MKFTCHLCGYDVTITKDDREGWGLDVLHECGLGSDTGTGYSFSDWEVRVLGGYEEACHRICVEEMRDPQCRYVFKTRMLSSEFSAFNGHRVPWSEETRKRMRQDMRDEVWRRTPYDHKLSLGEGEISCICGDAWPLLGKLTASVTTEDTPLNGEKK